MVLLAAAALLLSWTDHSGATTASLRGLDVVSSDVIWASGTNGTYLKSIDGGGHFRAAVVAGAESLDFRDVKAFDARNALLLSSGPGAQSRVYRTRDGGEHWSLVFTNADPNGFFDAFAFWNREHGILLGDPVNGHFVVFTTSDGGEHWIRQQMPPALPNEGAFAASGTCLIALGTQDAWLGTGGAGAGRVFHTTNRGRTWNVAPTPLSAASVSSGIYSLSFRDEHHGIAVGGDYQKPQNREHTVALTEDGGRTWRAAKAELGGYRSGVLFIDSRTLVAVGMSGSDISEDSGESWQTFSNLNLNAIAGARTSVWAAGPKGRVVNLTMMNAAR